LEIVAVIESHILYTFLLLLLIIFSILAVEFRSLIGAAISLGIASAVLSIIFYQLDSPYVAVFELSVCAGLITVLFMTAISLTRGEEE